MWIPKDATLIRGRRLFEAQRLLEEILHASFFWPYGYPNYRIVLSLPCSV